jgi:hypothetical protein
MRTGAVTKDERYPPEDARNERIGADNPLDTRDEHDLARWDDESPAAHLVEAVRAGG